LGQGPSGVPIDCGLDHDESPVALLKGAVMKHEFDHAANDSPRSGSSKQVTPLLWGAIVVAIVVLILWFAIKP
jgi:hypothetical protein